MKATGAERLKPIHQNAAAAVKDKALRRSFVIKVLHLLPHVRRFQRRQLVKVHLQQTMLALMAFGIRIVICRALHERASRNSAKQVQAEISLHFFSSDPEAKTETLSISRF